MEVSQLRDLVLAYEDKRGIAEDLDAQLKEANAAKTEAERNLIMAILSVAEETGIDDLSVNVEGRKYSVKVKDYFSIPKAEKDEAYRLLRELGHGDLITERVDDRTLSSEMASVMEEYRNVHPDSAEEFPVEYEPLLAVMNRYPKPSLSRIKAK